MTPTQWQCADRSILAPLVFFTMPPKKFQSQNFQFPVLEHPNIKPLSKGSPLQNTSQLRIHDTPTDIMLSARILARSAPRAAFQRIATSSSTPSTLGRRAASQLSAPARTTPFAHPRSILSQLASKQASPATASARLAVASRRALSSTAARRAGETDDELIAKVESELAYEDGIKDEQPMPTSIRDFLDNSPFTLEDVPGQQDVRLVREFGNEK